MAELNFKRIAVYNTQQDAEDKYLSESCDDSVDIVKPRKWQLGDKPKTYFNKYTEDVNPEEEVENKIFEDLDFEKEDNGPEDFKFEDLVNKPQYDDYEDDYEDDTEVDEDVLRSEVLTSIADCLNKYLRDHRGLYTDIDQADIDRICKIMTKDYLNYNKGEYDRDPADTYDVMKTELAQPGFFDDAFDFYLGNISKAKYNSNTFKGVSDAVWADPKDSLSEATVRSRMNDVVGYVVSNTLGHDGGYYLSTTDEGSSWAEDLEDADIFDSKDDAVEGLHEALLEGLDIPEAFKDHETNTESYEDWIDWIDYDALDNYEIMPVYANSASVNYSYLTRSGLKESRINDVLIILDEFDERFPKGNKNRDVYTLSKRLMDYAGLDKETATKIASGHLEGKLFNYY